METQQSPKAYFIAIVVAASTFFCVLGLCTGSGSTWLVMKSDATAKDGDKSKTSPKVAKTDENTKNPKKDKSVTDPEEKVTRANFNNITRESVLHVDAAEKILGPSREDGSTIDRIMVSWRSKDGKCTIRATFALDLQNYGLVNKTIEGD